MTGFINLYKPEGITSFLCVAKVRRIMGEKKAGHCGTLDPMAKGVLPIMLGGATRFLEFLPDSRKKYIAKFKLGITTDTLDITGNVLSEKPVNVGFSEVLAVAETFKGEIEQVPPMYSALSQDGVKLYKLARQGIEVERKPRPVTIYNLEVSPEGDEYRLDIECSSGTYVRTLIDDIGEKLGCGAVMTELTRTMGAGFEIDGAVTLEELEAAVDKSQFLIPVEEALNAYPTVKVSEGQTSRFKNGGNLSLERLRSCKVNGLYRVYSNDDSFIGLGEADTEKGEFIFRRVYQDR